jgi:hypothetical protein
MRLRGGGNGVPESREGGGSGEKKALFPLEGNGSVNRQTETIAVTNIEVDLDPRMQGIGALERAAIFRRSIRRIADYVEDSSARSRKITMIEILEDREGECMGSLVVSLSPNSNAPSPVRTFWRGKSGRWRRRSAREQAGLPG